MSQTYISIPHLRGIALETELSKKEAHYKGIIANLMVQKVLTDTIQGMASCRSCSESDITNMLTEQVSMAAIQRG